MQKTDNTKVYIIIGVFIVGISLYRFFTQYKPAVSNENFKQYIAEREKTLSAADSLKVTAFYNKIEKIRVQLSKLTEDIPEFSKLGAAADSELHLVSLKFLEFSFSAPDLKKEERDKYYAAQFSMSAAVPEALVNLYFGEASFTEDFSRRNWHKGLLSQIQGIEKDRYLSVLVQKSFSPPKIISETSFESGRYSGNLYVIDLSNAEIAAKVNIEAGNDSNLMVSKYIRGEAEKKLRDNLQRALIKSISQALEKLFSKSLPDPEIKIAGLKG